MQVFLAILGFVCGSGIAVSEQTNKCSDYKWSPGICNFLSLSLLHSCVLEVLVVMFALQALMKNEDSRIVPLCQLLRKKEFV